MFSAALSAVQLYSPVSKRICITDADLRTYEVGGGGGQKLVNLYVTGF
jgi:hypothetical protein